MTDVCFRPCQPQDVEQAIPLIYSSGPGAFNYVFSNRSEQQSLEFLREAFVRGDSEFGYQQHIAATHNGNIIGLGAVRSASQNPGFMLAALKQIFRFYSPLTAVATIVRGLRTEQIIQPPKSGVGMIYHLGISEHYRGQGIGQQLVDNLMRNIRQQGFPVAALDVAESNPRAKTLYQRLGFSEVKYRKGNLTSRFGHVGGHSYMEMELI